MSAFSAINLSRLPLPDVIRPVEFEALLAEMKAKAISLAPELADALARESDPASKILRVCAYFRMLDHLEFNDRSKANFLAFATGADLDGLAAYWGVERLVVQPADDSQVPPVPAILETDEALRYRVQLSLEGHSTAGPVGSYIFWALSASGSVRDVSVTSPTPGEALVTVLAHGDDGTASAKLLETVATVLEDVRPMTDLVTVQTAAVLPYQIEAELTLYKGPDAVTVMAAAQAAIETYVADHHRLGHDITLSGIYAALHQPGVQNVALAQPVADIIVDPTQTAWCSTAPTLTEGGRNV